MTLLSLFKTVLILLNKLIKNTNVRIKPTYTVIKYTLHVHNFV